MAPTTRTSSASSSAPNGATTIKWKGQEYHLKEPRQCSLKECKANFKRKVRIDQKIAEAEPEDKPKLIELREILMGLIEEQYKSPRKGVWKWQPSDLTDDTPGLYLLIYKNGSMKIGMSFSRLSRADRQKFVFAAKLMDLDDMEEIIPQELVIRIKELELPGLVFYSDKDSHLTALVLMQVCELFLACSRECATNTVGERLVDLPSERVREAVAQWEFDEEVVDLMRNIPNGGVFVQNSWPTLPSRLQRLAEESDFLPHRLRPEPPKGGYVTANRQVELLGEKLGQIQDSLEFSPREAQLDEVIQSLDPLLEGATNVFDVDEEIRAALAPIQGDDYSHYVEPTQAELAAGARIVLRDALDSLPTDHVIMIERNTVQALETIDETEEGGPFLDSVMDMDSAIDVMPDNPRALCLVRARSGHRIIITLSYFTAFAEEKTTTQRFKAVQAYCVHMDLLEASGNISSQRVSRQRKILRAFLMGIDANSTSDDPLEVPGYRKARLLAFPDGYFAGNRRDVKVVSGQLGIGYAEMLYLRERMGPTKVNKLLIAHGLLGNGLQTTSPLEPSWTCPGVPSVPGIEAQACAVEEGDPYTVMVGAQQPHHPLYGIFVCQRCHRKIERREKAILSAQESAGEISSEGQERLQVLNGRVLQHRERAKDARRDAIATHGLPTVQEKELAKHRKFQARQAEQFANDKKARENLLNRKRDEEAARKAMGKKKKSGFKRKSDAKKLYPPFFMQLLTKAARIWVHVTGEKHVYWNHIVNLFDELLKREHTRMPHMNVQFLEDGKPMGYLDFAYRQAVEGILVHEDPKSKLWRAQDFEATEAERKIERGAAIDKNGPGRIAHVIAILYEKENESENAQNVG